ncbi:MAG TPA: heme-copper oxidase subunit III [Candidatus Avipropionibacterium avicola]|uniref:cytochrome-c oxidase n=1 Tax=Candidatus Avipropionibacterium avicola TaxID=2840701 RepID=A0A9D1KMB5_9ACTN|nr:heme-copper oxidase subunit III [Candidatus Avipropionibacterium avicola]
MAHSVDSTSTASAKPSGALHAVPQSRLSGNPGRPDPVSVGTIVWLSSELMFFAALFAGYFTIQSVTNSKAPSPEESLWAVKQQLLNPTFAFFNTLVLVLSSVTCQIGVSKVHGRHHQVSREGKLWQINKWGMREWYVLTYIMGAFFVSGQVMEYAELIEHGLTISSDAYGSVFFLATGFHGLHVIGGLVAFLYLLGRTFLARRWTHELTVSAIVVSYYWHFVDVVWIVLFGVIYGDPLYRALQSVLTFLPALG